MDIPFRKIALDVGKESIMENTVATGAALGMLDIGLEAFRNVLRKAFEEKGGEVIQRNIACAEAGYNYARTNCTNCEAFRIHEPEYRRLMLIDGVHAIRNKSCYFWL